jgi:hypothetical protein
MCFRIVPDRAKVVARISSRGAVMHSHFSAWRTRILCLVRFGLLISGCVAMLASGALAATWSTYDLKSPTTALPSGTYSTTHTKWQVGNYYSDNLRIYALLCTPTSPPPYPVAILNHGLDWATAMGSPSTYRGIGQIALDGCNRMAASGWLTVITTYRGHYIDGFVSPPLTSDGLEGTPAAPLEFCHGEVDDVINLLSALTAKTDANGNPQFANPNQILMWGHSHGSCITERAVENGAPVQVVVSIDGPTDLTTWGLKNDLMFACPRSSAGPAACAGLPTGNPTALAEVKFLRIQAEQEMIVPVQQACELAANIKTSVNYRLMASVKPPGVYYLPPPKCAAFSMKWVNVPSTHTGPPPVFLPDEHLPPGATPSWPSPTLLVYNWPPSCNNGVCEVEHATVIDKSWGEFNSFVNSFAKTWAWPASIPPNTIYFEDP